MIPLVGIFILISMCVSCIDEMFSTPQQDGYITFGSIQTRAFDPSNPTEPGNAPDDYLVHSLRVLVFKTTGECEDNVYYYGSAVSETMVHPIKEMGTYRFVFLANEPSLSSIKSQLDNIQQYDDLRKIAYPAETFDSDQAIPMISQDDNIVILANGKFKVGNSGTEQTMLNVNFRRLAVRLDVTLLSVMNLENQDPATEKAFKGVTLSNLPDKVPLVWGLPSDRPAANAEYLDPSLSFNGSTPVEWDLDQKRTFTLENGDFGSEALTSEEQAEGYVWKRTLSRVVLPASYFTSKSDKGNAVQLTVNTNAYNPSCELEVKDNDYTLPANSRLDLRGIVQEPIEVNIIASPWDSVASNWETDQIYLNLSETEVNITDFNGARITFESNAPVIRVLGYYNLETNQYSNDAGQVFNQIQWTEDWNSRIKYTYDRGTQTGTGYMDIIVNNQAESAGKYSIVLAARRDESWNKPGLVLTRQIKVNITQEGIRNNFDVASADNPYGGTSYIGAFFRNTETGERIIQNRFGAGWWEASVPAENISGQNQQNWIILSSTPSFDPRVGTSTPGEAENYPVIPNKYKGEDGYKVTGKNRLYFRIGLRSKNTAALPRYGYVKLRYVLGELPSGQPLPAENATEVTVVGGATEQIKTVKIYVRQGEEPDVLLTTTSPVTGGPSTRPAESIVKFSPFNVTVQHMLDNVNSTNNFVVADSRDAAHTPVHVKYPTQAGAMFHWGAPPTSGYYRYAYYPRGLADNEFENVDPPSSVWPDRFFLYSDNPYWVAPSGSTETSYKDLVELCPDGYRRPNNGAVSALARNNTLAEVVKSEFMGSLFSEIPIGDGHKNIPDTYPEDPNQPEGILRYEQKPISNVRNGPYADGFFDRYPIQSNYNTGDGIAVGVCLTDTRAAYAGTLCFNPVTYASVFFPSAGRRDPKLQWRGSSGYYMTSSLGNQWIPKNETDKLLNFWDMEMDYRPRPVSAVLTFGVSMRCVKAE